MLTLLLLVPCSAATSCTLTIGAGTTLVWTDAILFVGLGSLSLPMTRTVFVRFIGVVGVNLIVIEAEPPLVMVPSTHSTAPLLNVQLPCEAVADTKLTPTGKLLLTTTPVAVHGPA